MDEALRLADCAIDSGSGGPFGAVVVREGKIIGRGYNRVLEKHDPTAHAEVEALRDAGSNVGTHDLRGCEVYTSCEPCPMCLAAILWARVDRVFYANTRDDAARIGFDDALFYEQLSSPLAMRKLSLTRAPHPRALESFTRWHRMADRVVY